MHRKISVTRRGRSAPLAWEWHAHAPAAPAGSPPVYFLMAAVAHPNRHAWWAVNVTVYLPAWISRTPLRRLPSTGWRGYRDRWAPLNPWRGRSRPWSRKAAR